MNCNLRNAVLAGSKLKSVLLDGCTLEEADCSELKLKGLELSDCDLKRIQLLHTPLAGIDLRSCEIAGLRLAVEDLRCAVVTAEQAIDLVSFLGVEVR